MLIFWLKQGEISRKSLELCKTSKMLYNIVVVLYCNILKYKEVIYLKELFVEKVIDKTKNFLDNNQRKILKEILTEICLNYQIEISEQNQREEISHNNEELLNIIYIIKRNWRMFNKNFKLLQG